MKTKTDSALRKWLLAAAPALGLFALTQSAHGINWVTLDDPDASINGTPATYALGISGSKVVGFYYTGFQTHGFLYDGSSYTVEDGPPINNVNNNGSAPVAYGISGSNVVGYYGDTSTGTLRGFLHSGGNYAVIDSPFTANPTTLVTAISGANIAGYYRGAGADQSYYSFLDQAGSFTLIDVPEATGTAGHYNVEAFGVDGANVVGTYGTPDGNFHGFLYNIGTHAITTLDDPLGLTGGYGTHAYGVYGNYVVGSYDDNTHQTHGFLYDGHTYTTLDDPNMGPSGGTTITGIEGTTIVGYYGGDGQHGFIATGVPEPSNFALLCLVVPALLGFRRRRAEHPMPIAR